MALNNITHQGVRGCEDKKKGTSIRYSDQSDIDGKNINVFKPLTKEERSQLMDIIDKLYDNGIKLLITYTDVF